MSTSYTLIFTLNERPPGVVPALALCATVRAGRDPKPRRFDLLLAAVAVALGIPLMTRNEADFTGIHASLAIIAVR